MIIGISRLSCFLNKNILNINPKGEEAVVLNCIEMSKKSGESTTKKKKAETETETERADDRERS